MKKTLILVTALFSLTVFAQVGIGTTTPAGSSILDLTATNKALLLTRVANTAAITNPVNGMLIYDISANCVKGFENGAWSGCLTATGSSGPGIGGTVTYSWETELRFKQYANVEFNRSNTLMSGGVTTDGKVFFWGRDYYGHIQGDGVTNGDAAHKASPVFMDGTGKWGTNAVKVQLANDGFYVLDSSGNIWSWGAQTQGQLGDGVDGANVTVKRLFANVNNVAKPAGVTSFTDMVMRSNTLFALGNNGRVYYYGQNPNPSLGTSTVTATLMPLPAGVTSVAKMWLANQRNGSSFFMLGNNGELYSFTSNQLLSGDSTVASSAATLNYFTPTKVNLPAGEASKVIKVDADIKTVFALTSDGKIYAWGRVKFDYGPSAGAAYGEINECMFNDQTGITTVPNVYAHRYYYAYNPKLVKLPAGETKFIDVSADDDTNHFLCESGTGYTLGYENRALEAGVLGANSSSFISYTDYQKTFAIEGINAIKISSDGYTSLVLDASGKLWGFGDNRYCMSGAGFNCPAYIATALPLMNGNLDPNNPRPQTVN